jgi:hypothetical protein
VRDPDDDRLDALAIDLMQRSRIADLKSDAAELSSLVAGLQRPLPILPTDDRQREAVLTILLFRERDRARRLLALVASGSLVTLASASIVADSAS